MQLLNNRVSTDQAIYMTIEHMRAYNITYKSDEASNFVTF